MSISKAKGTKKKCDDYFSLIIRSKMACERCGVRCPCANAPQKHNRGCPLTCSHIVGRIVSSTRTLEANAQCLCFTCHAYFTSHPVRFAEWLDETIGREEYYRLETIANTGVGKKFDWDEELIRLKGIYEQKQQGGDWLLEI